MRRTRLPIYILSCVKCGGYAVTGVRESSCPDCANTGVAPIPMSEMFKCPKCKRATYPTQAGIVCGCEYGAV
jgi:hypothetical protein